MRIERCLAAAITGTLLAAPWAVVAGRAQAQTPSNEIQASLIKVPDEVPKDAARYTFLLSGNKAGILAIWKTPDGARHSFFEFNDRGRGPRSLSRVTYGPEGFPETLAIAGHDYLKSPVEERFSWDGHVAHWKNAGEAGEKTLPAPGFYAAFSGDAADIVDLAHALLHSPTGSLPLLPEGTARITSEGTETIGAGGVPKEIAEYAISGLDFSPTPVWLTKDGDLFAIGVGWSAIVAEGMEAEWPKLQALQDRQSSAQGAALAAKAIRQPKGALVFRHANLFDSEAAASRPDMTVVISGNRVVAVGKEGTIPIPEGADVVDAKGKALLPGLWDMHVHLGGSDGVLHVAAGVTTVRDMGNDIDLVGALKRQYASRELVGPRVINAGLIDGRGPYQGPTKVFADTPEEARADIERFKSLGYEQIKVYSSLKPELLPGIAEETHRLGLRLSGHVPAFMNAEQFIKDGADEIQHINFIVLNFFFDEVKDTRTPARFTVVAEHAAELDLGSPRVRAFVKLMLDHHTVLDPTVSVFEEMFLARPGEMDPIVASVASRFPAQVRRSYLAQGLPVPEGRDARYKDSAAALLRMIKLLHESGVTLVAGTDSLPGFVLHSELGYYVAAGIPAPKVLQLATIGAARVMRHDAELGSIVAGKLADVILVDGDPSQRIGDIRRVVSVVKDGFVYDPAALYASLGVSEP